MAAGKFFFYTTAVKYILQGAIDLDTVTIDAYLLQSGYTPGTASHSALAQITSGRATSSGSVVNSLALSGTKITGSGAGQVIFDAADISGFSAGGSTMKAKYVALVARSASSGGVDNLLIGFMDLETTATTGLEGTQINITWNAGGIAEIYVNQTS